MGKIRTRVLGNEEVEEKQKKEQKNRSDEKKAKKGTTKKVEETIEVEKENPKKASKEVKSVEKKSDLKKVVKEEEKSRKKQPKRGKKYLQVLKKLDSKKVYSLSESVALLKKLTYAAFDESVELHFSLDEPGLRGEVDLPHSIGKTVRVKIVDDSVIGAIEKGVIDFDILITHPSFMPKLVKFAKLLGPRGLMPNPKAGTVSTNPEETKKKFTKGVIRWKSEAKTPLIHQLIGKISYKPEDIEENVRTYIKSVGPVHIRKAFIKTTMSPSVRFNIES